MTTDAKIETPQLVATGDLFGVNLSRRICPGCGTLNPKSAVSSYFSCVKCGWESYDGLPTIRKIMRGGFKDCSNVNLSAFLKTLFSSPNNEVSDRAGNGGRA